MSSLNPASGLLLREFENAPSQAVINAVGFTTVTEWQWNITPALPDGMSIEPDGHSLEISWELLLGVFQIEAIRYRDAEGVMQTVTVWDSVPGGAQVTEFRPDSIAWRGFSLWVKAIGTEPAQPSGTQPAEAEGTFEIEVVQNYDINRDILAGVINAGS